MLIYMIASENMRTEIVFMDQQVRQIDRQIDEILTGQEMQWVDDKARLKVQIRWVFNQFHVWCASFPHYHIIDTALEKAVGSGDGMDILLNGSPKNLPLPLILILHVNLRKENILRSFFRGDERNPFTEEAGREDYPACPSTENNAGQ